MNEALGRVLSGNEGMIDVTSLSKFKVKDGDMGERDEIAKAMFIRLGNIHLNADHKPFIEGAYQAADAFLAYRREEALKAEAEVRVGRVKARDTEGQKMADESGKACVCATSQRFFTPSYWPESKAQNEYDDFMNRHPNATAWRQTTKP